MDSDPMQYVEEQDDDGKNKEVADAKKFRKSSAAIPETMHSPARCWRSGQSLTRSIED